jgi:hypothetical protein
VVTSATARRARTTSPCCRTRPAAAFEGFCSVGPPPARRALWAVARSSRQSVASQRPWPPSPADASARPSLAFSQPKAPLCVGHETRRADGWVGRRDVGSCELAAPRPAVLELTRCAAYYALSRCSWAPLLPLSACRILHRPLASSFGTYLGLTRISRRESPAGQPRRGPSSCRHCSRTHSASQLAWSRRSHKL